MGIPNSIEEPKWIVEWAFVLVMFQSEKCSITKPHPSLQKRNKLTVIANYCVKNLCLKISLDHLEYTHNDVKANRFSYPGF